MSTIESFQQLAVTMRSAFGDAFRPIEYASMPAATYDTSTGAVGDGTPTKYTLSAMFSRFSHYQRMTDGIPVDDWKMLFATLDAPALDPRVGDLVSCAAFGPVWEVIHVFGDPVEALRSMQVRRVRKAFPV